MSKAVVGWDIFYTDLKNQEKKKIKWKQGKLDW